ncbi:PP2C family protein-serine/threonine phosphatase [Streptomyces sp. NPDC058335]|uniref:PP2C family protein-serine/threonine phosphatase n=1 Tax=Streptomyces sp. NPDC058335 TaxID=3346451 RepID=UPI00365FB9F8
MSPSRGDAVDPDATADVLRRQRDRRGSDGTMERWNEPTRRQVTPSTTPWLRTPPPGDLRRDGPRHGSRAHRQSGRRDLSQPPPPRREPHRSRTVHRSSSPEQFHKIRYATGILAASTSPPGSCAGSTTAPSPVLIRGGRWVTTLAYAPTHPLGTDLGLTATVCQEHLEPGDRLLFYTDGITEAPDARGQEFGRDRFVDFIVRQHADGVPLPETLRRRIHSVLRYHHGRLADYATVLCCEWSVARDS